MQDSNLRPSAPKADALPNCANGRWELAVRVELTTFALQVRCSTVIAMLALAPQVGLEPTARELTVRCSTIELLWNVVRPEGFEPSTSGIEARCSVH